MDFYDYIEIIFLAFIQGMSEFLPISSSGHLVLWNAFFNSKPLSILFVLVLHLGTLMAILTYYKKDILVIVGHFAKDLKEVLGFRALVNKGGFKFLDLKFLNLKQKLFFSPGKGVYLLVWATWPSVLGALWLSPLVELSFQKVTWVGFGFIFTGSYLFLTRFKLGGLKVPAFLNRLRWFDFFKKVGIGQNTKPAGGIEASPFMFQELTFSKAFFIGLMQILAFFPGMSRSGWTIATALFLGCSKKESALFGFLLAIPAILGACVWELLQNPWSNLWQNPLVAEGDKLNFYPLILAFLASWLFGWLALKIFVRSLKNLSFPYFAFYLWPLGLFTIFYFL